MPPDSRRIAGASAAERPTSLRLNGMLERQRLNLVAAIGEQLEKRRPGGRGIATGSEVRCQVGGLTGQDEPVDGAHDPQHVRGVARPVRERLEHAPPDAACLDVSAEAFQQARVQRRSELRAAFLLNAQRFIDDRS